MVSPHGIKLAAHIISVFYGDLCSKVCECLLQRGTLSLAEINRHTELSRAHVVNCLRVLIHQNCIQAFATELEGGFRKSPTILTLYMVVFENIIHKLRAPKFMQIVSEELGKECLEIFQGLIQHGRLSLNQIIDRNEETAGSSDINILRENFEKLLNARFVERCPAPEPFVAPPPKEETLAKKPLGPKSTKVAEEPEKTTEQRALEAAAPMESLRFLMETNDIAELNIKGSPSNDKPGEKRKRDTIRSDDDVLDANKQIEVLWRVNFEEFVRRLRDKACISYVKTRINNEAGLVLAAMLDITRCSNSRLKAGQSEYQSINDIYDEVIKKEGGVAMDFERVRASLDLLGCQTISTGLDESYSIDIKRIVQMAQNEEVESVVLRRYGREAYRIFRLLSKAGRVCETDKIADATFVEKKDAIKILYNLWKDDFLHMEKVMTSGSRQALFLLWSVNKQPLLEKFLDDMYHAALNLKLRIKHEVDQGKEVPHMPKEKRVGDLEKKYLANIRVILEASLINLDDAIMWFSDF